MQGSK